MHFWESTHIWWSLICLRIFGLGLLQNQRAMESPLLRAGVAAAQLALSVSPRPKKEEQGEEKKVDPAKKEIKTEVKGEGSQDPW